MAKRIMGIIGPYMASAFASMAQLKEDGIILANSNKSPQLKKPYRKIPKSPKGLSPKVQKGRGLKEYWIDGKQYWASSEKVAIKKSLKNKKS